MNRYWTRMQKYQFETFLRYISLPTNLNYTRLRSAQGVYSLPRKNGSS